MGSFAKSIDLYPEKHPNGKLLKHIKFRFQIFYDGEKICEIGWDLETTDETVGSLSQRKPDDVIKIDLDLDELETTSAESRATYEQIKDYVLKQYDLKVSSLYISQVKRKNGLTTGENYNHAKSDKYRQPVCPEEKEWAILAALEKFGMV